MGRFFLFLFFLFVTTWSIINISSSICGLHQMKSQNILGFGTWRIDQPSPNQRDTLSLLWRPEKEHHHWSKSSKSMFTIIQHHIILLSISISMKLRIYWYNTLPTFSKRIFLLCYCNLKTKKNTIEVPVPKQCSQIIFLSKPLCMKLRKNWYSTMTRI